MIGLGWASLLTSMIEKYEKELNSQNSQNNQKYSQPYISFK